MNYQIVNCKVRGLLERNAYNPPTVSEIDSAITDEEMSEVLYRHFALKGHTAPTRCVGTHSPRQSPRSMSPLSPSTLFASSDSAFLINTYLPGRTSVTQPPPPTGQRPLKCTSRSPSE